VKPWSKVLTTEVDSRAIDEGWRGVRARRERPRTARRIWVVAPVVALALVLLLLGRGKTWSSAPAPLALAGGAPMPEEWSARFIMVLRDIEST